MDMELAFYGFGSFFLFVTSTCVLALIFSEPLEARARRILRKNRLE